MACSAGLIRAILDVEFVSGKGVDVEGVVDVDESGVVDVDESGDEWGVVVDEEGVVVTARQESQKSIEIVANYLSKNLALTLIRWVTCVI